MVWGVVFNGWMGGEVYVEVKGVGKGGGLGGVISCS